MCGRYVLKATLQELERKYGAVPEGTFSVEPNYNVAPSLRMPVVVEQDDQRKIDKYRWGLIPFWADDDISFYRVDREVNNACNSGEQLLEPCRDLFS